jgi:cellulose synthase/poly-beta-1,6-N-acetylglucosamine synthase-like glycosyltransferase
MDSSAALTVIVPVRSMAGLLRLCLDNLMPQLGPDDAVIVVDDGSTDNTAKVASEAGAQVMTGPGKGPYYARNLAARTASTPYLLFIDARCQPRAGLVTAHREMLQRPDAALSCTAVTILPGPSFAGRVAVSVDAFRMDTKVGVPGRLDFYPTANLGVARVAFEQVGGFDEVRSGGDAMLCWQIQSSGLGHLEADPRPLMDWQARGSLRGLIEQTYRYGRSSQWLDVQHSAAIRKAGPPPTRPRPPHYKQPHAGGAGSRRAAAALNLAFRAGTLAARLDR